MGNKILIPDEFIPDYEKSEEEQKEEWLKRREESEKAFKELYGLEEKKIERDY